MGEKLICMNPYITCYARDYPKWPMRSMNKYYEYLKVKNTEFKEPIAESFKNYLCLQEPCPPDTLEETDPFYDKVIIFDWFFPLEVILILTFTRNFYTI